MDLEIKKDIEQNNLIVLKLRDYDFDISIYRSDLENGLYRVLATKYIRPSDSNFSDIHNIILTSSQCQNILGYIREKEGKVFEFKHNCRNGGVYILFDIHFKHEFLDTEEHDTVDEMQEDRFIKE